MQPRKLDPKDECPTDNLIYSYFVQPYTATFHEVLHLTPNGITTIAFALQLVALWMLVKGHGRVAGALWLLGYMFDCMDGYMARTYKLTSKFGDLYDHATDLITLLRLLCILAYNRHFAHMLLVIIAGILATWQMGCQESMYAGTESTSLQPLKGLACACPDGLRWFGVGTANVVIAAILFSMQK